MNKLNTLLFLFLSLILCSFTNAQIIKIDFELIIDSICIYTQPNPRALTPFTVDLETPYTKITKESSKNFENEQRKTIGELTFKLNNFPKYSEIRATEYSDALKFYTEGDEMITIENFHYVVMDNFHTTERSEMLTLAFGAGIDKNTEDMSLVHQLKKVKQISKMQFSIYKKMMTDNDSVRVSILPSLVQLIKLSQNTDLQKMNIQFVIAASEDKSWRVRNELAKIFPEFANAFGAQINEIVPTLATLIKDSETEVRLNALKGLNLMLLSINNEKVSACIIPSLLNLNNESSHEVKASIGETFGLIAKAVGYSTFNSKLGKIMDTLMKDENADVRLGIAKSLFNIFISSEGALINSINAIIGTMQKDSQYRIRESIYQTLAQLGVYYGIEVFKSSIEPLFFNYLSDTVSSVREVGVECLKKLIEKFGSAWVTSGLIPKLQSHLTTPKLSYLNRMCILHSLLVCAKFLDTKQNNEFILPIIAKGIKDKIANVRFYTVKLVNEYIKQFDSSSKEKIKTLIRDLTKDEDNDVKFYASKLLESMK